MQAFLFVGQEAINELTSRSLGALGCKQANVVNADSPPRGYTGISAHIRAGRGISGIFNYDTAFLYWALENLD
jgi:hypothetical protein